MSSLFKKGLFAKIALAALTVMLWSACCLALMEALSTEMLTQGSELVIRGTVAHVESRWSRNRDRIFTRAAVRVTRVLTGRCLDTTILVEYPGGEIGDIGLGVSDQPRLKKGEDVILFLQPVRPHAQVYAVYGAAQGKYTIQADGRAVKGGFSIVKNTANPVSIDNNIPVDELIQKIKKSRQKPEAR